MIIAYKIIVLAGNLQIPRAKKNLRFFYSYVILIYLIECQRYTNIYMYVGAQTLGMSSAVFPGTFSGRWLGTVAPGSWNSSHGGCHVISGSFVCYATSPAPIFPLLHCFCQYNRMTWPTQYVRFVNMCYEWSSKDMTLLWACTDESFSRWNYHMPSIEQLWTLLQVLLSRSNPLLNAACLGYGNCFSDSEIELTLLTLS